MSDGLHGIAASFASAAPAVAAVRAARAAGYDAVDLCSPMPIEGLGEVLGVRSRIAAATLIGGVVGGSSLLLLAWWCQAHEWTLDVGGRRPFAATGFVVPAFEVTILFAGLATALALLFGCRLPRLHHPLFAVPGFERGSQDRFYVVIEARDSAFDAAAVRRFLGSLSPLEVVDVPA